MTKFTDGPAAGTVLGLRRAPRFLRVVVGTDGTVDALDLLGDTARSTESVYAYRKLSDDGGLVHIDGRGKNGKRFGITVSPATYSLIEDQPDDEVLRDNKRWAEWATARATS